MFMFAGFCFPVPLHSLFSVFLLLGLRFSASDVTDAVFVRVATAIIFLAPISAFDQVRSAFLCVLLSSSPRLRSSRMFLRRCGLYINVIATLPYPFQAFPACILTLHRTSLIPLY